MKGRIVATAALLIFAVLAFCGAGEGEAGPFNSFGILFVIVAVVVWRHWAIIAGKDGPALFDGAWGGFVSARGDYYRAADDHYRRDGHQNYSESDRR